MDVMCSVPKVGFDFSSYIKTLLKVKQVKQRNVLRSKTLNFMKK